MDPEDDPFEVELQNVTFFLAFCFDWWKGASNVWQKKAALVEAHRLATEKPWLLKFLPGWFKDLLQTSSGLLAPGMLAPAST